jgi:NTP pyrophosphatase (non-canonical NTP hydrolase)
MEELKKEIKKYINERGWSILKNPSSISKSISIESSELLEIFQWKDLSIKNIKQDQIILQKIKEELADVLIYSIEMAISLNLDIEKLIYEKLEKNIKKYPASIVKGNQSEYLKIKESYRKNKK